MVTPTNSKRRGREAARNAVSKALWWYDYPADMATKDQEAWLEGFAFERSRILDRLAGTAVKRAYNKLRREDAAAEKGKER